MNDMNDLEDRIEELKSELEKLGEEKIGKAERKAKAYAQILREKGMQMMNKARETGKNVDNYAHENPWVMAGAGIAIGFLIGMVMTKKKGCRHC